MQEITKYTACECEKYGKFASESTRKGMPLLYTNISVSKDKDIQDDKCALSAATVSVEVEVAPFVRRAMMVAIVTAMEAMAIRRCNKRVSPRAMVARLARKLTPLKMAAMAKGQRSSCQLRDRSSKMLMVE
jgi:hypothetical protein